MTHEFYLDNFRHLLLLDCSIAVNIVHLEGPIQFLLGLTPRGYIDRQEEFIEVYLAGVVLVEGPEDMRAKLVRVAGREEAAVDLDELLFAQLA